MRRGIEQNGHAPTVREIGAVVGLSSSCTVKKHLDTLIIKGHLRRDRYKRSVELMEGGEPLNIGRTVFVPLLGRVAGGPPMLAVQDTNPELLPIPSSLLGRGTHSGDDLFALEVCGESMRDIGIGDGDLIVARKQNTARDGDIIVALIDEEATVKTFYKERDTIRLQPENEAFEPIFARDVRILGKVALAIKRF